MNGYCLPLDTETANMEKIQKVTGQFDRLMKEMQQVMTGLTVPWKLEVLHVLLNDTKFLDKGVERWFPRFHDNMLANLTVFPYDMFDDETLRKCFRRALRHFFLEDYGVDATGAVELGMDADALVKNRDWSKVGLDDSSPREHIFQILDMYLLSELRTDDLMDLLITKNRRQTEQKKRVDKAKELQKPKAAKTAPKKIFHAKKSTNQ